MSSDIWDEVERRMGAHEYMHGVERTVERVRATAEVFTPTPLVLEIVRELPADVLAPGKTVLDPACGDGQFLVAAKWVKVLRYGMTEEEALADLFGVDIMRDNVDLCRLRLRGGTIIMGDSLHPMKRLDGQTEEEHQAMRRLFSANLEFGDPPSPSFRRPPKGEHQRSLWADPVRPADHAA